MKHFIRCPDLLCRLSHQSVPDTTLSVPEDFFFVRVAFYIKLSLHDGLSCYLSNLCSYKVMPSGTVLRTELLPWVAVTSGAPPRNGSEEISDIIVQLNAKYIFNSELSAQA